MNEAVATRVISPCIGVCVLDEETNLCKGCWRSLQEVAEWASADNDRRRDIVELARGRRDAARAQGTE